MDSTVSGLAKGSSTSGCQEGFGIEARNDDASLASIERCRPIKLSDNGLMLIRRRIKNQLFIPTFKADCQK